MTVAAISIPLGLLATGRTGLVKEAFAGRILRQRLIDMGVAPGARVRVIRNEPNGPMIISIGEARLAIGRGMALKIMVEET